MSILILGKGWTGLHLATYLTSINIQWFATTTSGRDSTIKWSIGQATSNLPKTTHVIITFPVQITDLQSLVLTYPHKVKWMLLGSTRGYTSPGENNRHSPQTTDRTLSETFIVQHNGLVLHLAGLWDNVRYPVNWIPRVAASYEKLLQLDNLHLIHGSDLARAIYRAFLMDLNGIWIVSDSRIYDWWRIIERNGNSDLKKWVKSAMDETGVDTLPRKGIGRWLDSSDFWNTIKIAPEILFSDGM